ncbi:Protein of unknown function [Bacillus wiedmannii]|uniref:Uncharacterized protein n=1 Tax=Bacillus wiedmannii TaxID=1890302 RepID=A0A1C6XBB7_9BACI|nr:Protein of unknown function [Bacillus wiedmannii]SCM01000.1 Protein of unknown function [Bacillus wiedmannii]
MAIPSIEFGK